MRRPTTDLHDPHRCHHVHPTMPFLMPPTRLALLALSLGLAACQASDRPAAEGAEPEPASVAEPAAPAAPAEPVAQGPAPLTAEGWGPLRIGMTREQVVAAAGEDANPEAVGGPEPERCDEFRPERAPERMLVMVERDTLTRISLLSRSEVRTDRGLAVGDPAAAVRAAYGDRAAVSPHKYLAAPAEYITVWEVAPPGPQARGIRYEVGTDGRVSHIHAGGPSIEYVEGCL